MNNYAAIQSRLDAIGRFPRWEWEGRERKAYFLLPSGEEISVGPFPDNSGRNGLGSSVDQAAAAIIASGVRTFRINGNSFNNFYIDGEFVTSYGV